MATLNEKIREIINFYKLSDRQFAIKIGVTQSVIGSMFQKGTEPSAKVIRLTLTAFPELSADWLLRGEGEMLKTPTILDIDRIATLVDTIATLQKTIADKDKTIEILNNQIQQLNNKIK